MGLLEFLTGRQNEVLDSINGITLTPEEIIRFGDVVKDYSAIHRDLDLAREHGFTNTPVIGVHIAAIGGRLSRDLIAVIQGQDTNFHYTAQKVTFREPVYPNEPINWAHPKFEQEGETVRCKLSIPNQDPNNKPRVEMVSEFRLERSEFQGVLGERCYTEEVEIRPAEVERFYRCLKEEPVEAVAFSHGIAMIPSVLLSLAAGLNRLQDTSIGGKNIEMESRAYSELQTGKARVEIYFVERKGRGTRNSYVFDGVIYQDGGPVISSRVKTLTNGEFSQEALKTLQVRLVA